MIALLVHALIPFINSYAFEGLQKLIGALDRAPSLVKGVMAAVGPVFIGMLAGAVGVALPGDVHGWVEATMLGLLEGLVSIGFHEKQIQALQMDNTLHPLT